MKDTNLTKILVVELAKIASDFWGVIWENRHLFPDIKITATYFDNDKTWGYIYKVKSKSLDNVYKWECPIGAAREYLETEGEIHMPGKTTQIKGKKQLSLF